MKYSSSQLDRMVTSGGIHAVKRQPESRWGTLFIFTLIVMAVVIVLGQAGAL